jgi:hypothetical protein
MRAAHTLRGAGDHGHPQRSPVPRDRANDSATCIPACPDRPATSSVVAVSVAQPNNFLAHCAPQSQGFDDDLLLIDSIPMEWT